jgi:hypothetical protein
MPAAGQRLLDLGLRGGVDLDGALAEDTCTAGASPKKLGRA